MSTERLSIVVTERGSRVVKRNLEGIGEGARRAEGGAMLLRRALGAFAVVALIRGLVRIADAFTNIQNRLRLVTSSTVQLNTVSSELLAISNRTRSSLSTNADLYNRLALSTRELGLTQRDVLQLTESLNQAVIISGASSQEASAGLVQLSQGLASGALRGDELRSVLEQLPAVADVIATELGVTRGKLRELGSQGKITADIVTRAFANAREELNDRFGKTVPTISQGFQVLTNSVSNLFGRLSEASGFSSLLANTLNDLGLAISENTDGFVAGAIALRGYGETTLEVLALIGRDFIPALGLTSAAIGEFFANLVGADDLADRYRNSIDAFGAEIDFNSQNLQKEIDAIRERTKARKEAAALKNDVTLDLPVGGGGGSNVAVEVIEKVDQATQSLVDSQIELLAQLRMEKQAFKESTESGEDFELVLDRLATNTIAAETGLQGLADSINATKSELALLREQQSRGDFLTELEEENAALQKAAVSGREVNAVLEEMSIRKQFASDPEGLARALDLTKANETLREQLDESTDVVSSFLTKARENAQDILGNALSKAFNGGLEDIPAQFAQVLLQLSSQFLASEIFSQLGSMGQSSDSSGLASMVGSFFAGSFAKGGQFTVPNTGGSGPDSVPTTMNLTPRETVTITPAGQSPGGDKQMPAINVPPAQVVVVDSEEKARQLINGPANESAVLTIIRNNAETVKGVTG